MPLAPPVTTTTWPAALMTESLARLGPALGEGKRAGAEGPALALPRPGLARRLDAVTSQSRAQRRHENRAHAVGPVGRRVRLRMDQQRVAHPVPGERDLLAMRSDALGPEIPIIAGLCEGRVGHGDRRVLELGIEHALDRRLQPARHRDVVGIDPPAVVRELALEIEHVPGPRRAEDDAPEARIGLVGVAVALAQPNERVLAREDHAVCIRHAHGATSPKMPGHRWCSRTTPMTTCEPRKPGWRSAMTSGESEVLYRLIAERRSIRRYRAN